MGGSKERFVKISGNSVSFEKWLRCHIFGVSLTGLVEGLPVFHYPSPSPMSNPGGRSDLRCLTYTHLFINWQGRQFLGRRVARSKKFFAGFLGGFNEHFWKFQAIPAISKNGGVASFRSGVARSGCGVASFSISLNEPSPGSIRPPLSEKCKIFKNLQGSQFLSCRVARSKKF